MAGESRFVSGNSTFSDCGLDGSDYAISLTGDLEGCLSTFVQDFKCKDLADYDLYLESGRDAYGDRVASGVYFVRLTAGRTTETRKVVLRR